MCNGSISAGTRPAFALMLLTFGLIGSVALGADAPMQFKQLAGPPSEMAAMAPPDPVSSATRSKSAIFDVTLHVCRSRSRQTSQGMDTSLSKAPVHCDWYLTRQRSISAPANASHSSRASRTRIAGSQRPASSQPFYASQRRMGRC